MVDIEARPTPSQLDRLRSTFDGEIVPPGHAGDEDARKVWNGEATVVRLTALKRAWDPDNVFHLNHNVAP